MKPVISVILPVFNAESTLKESLDSIIGQTVPVELIVVAGPSADRSDSILQSYLPHIHHFIRDEGKGVYAAMNVGIMLAGGEWFYFIGADDRLAGSTVFAQLIGDGTQSSGIRFGDVRYVGEKPRGVPNVHNSSFGKSLYWKNSLHHQSVLYHRSCFSSLLYDESFKILADYKLNLLLFRQSIVHDYIPGIVAECRAEGLSKKFEASLYKEELRLKKEVLPFFYYLLNQVWVWIKYGYKNQSFFKRG